MAGRPGSKQKINEHNIVLVLCTLEARIFIFRFLCRLRNKNKKLWTNVANHITSSVKRVKLQACLRNVYAIVVPSVYAIVVPSVLVPTHLQPWDSLVPHRQPHCTALMSWVMTSLLVALLTLPLSASVNSAL